jgi:N,N'-diacetyllegionaminate synthase
MKPVLIIAEAGVNHNGDLNIAKALIDAASDAKVDIVKFQTYKTEKLVSKEAKQASYQQKNTKLEGQFAMLKKLELPEDWHYKLKDYAVTKGVQFLSTGFDHDSLDFLNSMGPSFFKIPSGEISNKPYLEHVAAFKKPIVLSTGMSNMEEISAALSVLANNGISKEQLCILHCNTEYPTPFEDVNLKAMCSIQNHFNVEVGYSDHTLGIEVAVAAVALGAKVIEKHFTISRAMEGPDHAASLEPDELKEMVKSIRNIEKALSGNGIKAPSPSELKNKTAARKSIHINTALNTNDRIERHHLDIKRPGDGINPMQIDEVVGKKIKTDLQADSKLKWEDLE